MGEARGKSYTKAYTKVLAPFHVKPRVNDSQKSLDFPQGQQPYTAMLTDHEIEGLKPREKAYKVYDQNGLFLRIYSDGRRNWFCRYQMNGKIRELGLGVYSKVTLAQARAMSTNIKMQRLQGIDLAPVSRLPKALLEGVPSSEENIAEAIRIAANKARAQQNFGSIEERLSAVERQLERLTTALLTLAAKIDQSNLLT